MKKVVTTEILICDRCRADHDYVRTVTLYIAEDDDPAEVYCMSELCANCRLTVRDLMHGRLS